MFKKNQIEEEKKVENSDKKINGKRENYFLLEENKSFKQEKDGLNIFSNHQQFSEINSSSKGIRNKYKKLKKGIIENNSQNFLEQKIEDNKTDLIDNKNVKHIRKILLDEDEIYNAFVFFQQLIKKEESKNESQGYFKDKLFEFILNSKKRKTKILPNTSYKKNKNILKTYDCFHLYSKTILNCDKINSRHLTKSLSFSFKNNNKNNIFHNFLNLSQENMKNTPKSASQIFDEFYSIENKIRDKTISEENSQFSNHEYSFDLKHKERNEISFQSIQEKEKTNIKFFDFNNNSFEDNYNSNKNEIENDNKSEKILIKNFKNFNLPEDLLNEYNLKKNVELNSERNKKEEDLNNCLYDKDLFKEKLVNFPTKDMRNELYTEKQNIKIKNKESFIENEKVLFNEIKVNKSRILFNKENLINEKLKELDEEIKHFNEETKKMKLIKDEYEKLKINLLKDTKEFNLKKEIQEKYFIGDFDRLKNIPKAESKLIMTITQHNKSLILNNDRKTETIKLLKKRIYQLEKIIKNKNKNIQESKKIHEKIIKSIRKNNINIFIKKRNEIKKKNNNDRTLKNIKVNLKKNLASCSIEKIKENNRNDNLNQNLNKNPIFNNLNELYFENQNNKKSINSSYNIQRNITNNLRTNKNLNINNLIDSEKRNIDANSHGYNMTIVDNISKKIKHNYTNRGNINNSRTLKGNVKNENPNLNIYEKLLRNDKEKERQNKYKRIKLNINSMRDLGDNKKLIKKLKTEFHCDNEKIKDKYKSIINNIPLYEIKNNYKNYQISNRKHHILRKSKLKSEINKNKSNSNIYLLNKFKNKNNKAKNISSSKARNTIDYEKIPPDDNNKINRKENNSLDNKIINIKNKSKNNLVIEEDDDNIEGYDFIIPEKYKLMINGNIINSINSDGKIINIYENNKKEIIFQSGVRKEIFPDGYQLINFPNGDKKQKFIGKNEKVMYFYNETNTVQTSYKNGINIFKFNNGQIEKHYPDGSKYIFYPNGMRRKISKNGTETDFISEEQKTSNENEIKAQIVDIIDFNKTLK